MWERVAGERAASPSRAPSLNVKCLTGRLSEEGLQRTEAPLEPGGGVGGWRAGGGLVEGGGVEGGGLWLCHSAKTGAAADSNASTDWLQFKLPTSTTNVGAAFIYRRL